MIRPKHFSFNTETAASNGFQRKVQNLSSNEIIKRALNEFEDFVTLLKFNDIETIVFEDKDFPITPDSIFPNNWFSTDGNGLIISYPMYAHNRRLEQRQDIIDMLCKNYYYKHNNDLKKLEEDSIFLEGTGSLVLDREFKIAYAALSQRTSSIALKTWSNISGYKVISFNTIANNDLPVYHTNVMMCVGDNFALVCLDCIDYHDRKMLRNSLLSTGKTIIELNKYQTFNSFAANMLGLCNMKGERLLIMSETAKKSLNADQIKKIKALKLKIISASIPLIEYIGGGSARCMLTEII